MFDTVIGAASLGVWVLMLVLKGFAFIDCIRRPAAAFPAIGRKSKTLWLVLTGLAALTAVVPSLTFDIFGIAGAVAALVYLFDVRPKIAEITGR